MNSNEFKSLKTRIAFIAALKIILFSLIAIFTILLLIDFILEDFLANTVYGISIPLYYYFQANKKLFMTIVYIVVFIVTAFFVIRNTENNLIILIKSMDKILSNPEDEITLPSDLSLLERRLNNIRVDLITSKNNEKEANNKKNDLIMYMAHDLKTPLTSIIGYLTLLKEEENISKEVEKKYIKTVLDKAYRLEELTNQFFEITRYNLQDMPINKKKIDLSILLSQIADEFYPMMQEKNMDIKLKADSIIFYGDGDKLARAFTNLLRNAVSYSYDNSIIYVTAINCEKNIKIIFKNKGDKIPEYKLDKIFDKFYRADESRSSSTGGTGLGLAITKEIIKLHGGDINVCNEGEFIKFLVVLPKE